jgi:hypothetical protein
MMMHLPNWVQQEEEIASIMFLVHPPTIHQLSIQKVVDTNDLGWRMYRNRQVRKSSQSVKFYAIVLLTERK